ncbi:atrial natriuretic peptide receptor 2 [Nephila pilipes]|uniref:Atrial natriuretic peptide receptor 2 n=1 Tax=Nephila pilipes TaxID=299642 RepID=A0A8X6NYI8_NEPPI|nr:atrial natriuretic peptide receptor 2 [Nephila pilipes]
MTWKIRWEDIVSTKQGVKKRSGSRQSLTRSLGSSCPSEAMSIADINRQVFVRNGYYKGMVVAIKTINKSRVDITRSLLLELKRSSKFAYVSLQIREKKMFLIAFLKGEDCSIGSETLL